MSIAKMSLTHTLLFVLRTEFIILIGRNGGTSIRVLEPGLSGEKSVSFAVCFL